MKRNHKITLGVIIALSVTALLWGGYRLFFSPTRIALINFPAGQFSNFVLSNNTRHIRIDRISEDAKTSLRGYDAIFLFGPGMRLGNELNTRVQQAIDRGTAVYSFVFTTARVNCHNMDSTVRNQLDLYYQNRSTRNYRNMLRYVRHQFDGSKWPKLKVEAPAIIPSDFLFYTGSEEPFLHAKDLTAYLKQRGLYQSSDINNNIAFIIGSVPPMEGNRAHIDTLIAQFTRRGYNVYPITARKKRVALLREVAPAGVIYFAMGRLQGDKAVQYLSRENIPLFCPLPLAVSHEEWTGSKQGAAGGFLTARVVLPEIDGGIAPMVISTNHQITDSLIMTLPEPERMQMFADYMDNYLKLRIKPNDEKRIAIGYFRGPGNNSLVATGLEVVPSLYQLLRRLKSEGYRVDGLPESEEAFARLIATEGPLFSGHDEGAIDRYLTQGHPEWIAAEDYAQWLKKDVAPHRIQELTEVYGNAPGLFMIGTSDTKRRLAVPRIRLGNVVLFPQPRAAIGGEDFSVIHGGANVPPPHNYIATYLWLQNDFKADALLHFGTHGSLEFMPGKQVALSGEDWPDRLIGSIPHFYYYCIGNVGEAILAKRRSRTATISYLTPPFVESNMKSRYSALQKLIGDYFATNGKAAVTLAGRIKSEVVALGMNKELQLDADLQKTYSEADIELIDNYIGEIAQEKITGALYTLGKPFSPHDLHSTVMALSIDPIAYAKAKIDLLQKRITPEQYANYRYMAAHYIEPAHREAAELFASNIVTETYAPTKGKMSKMKKDKKPHLSPEAAELKFAQKELETARLSVSRYRDLLIQSPEAEMQSLINAFSGGYIEPSPGGDVVSNPNTLPTGRNLYSINAESTPGERAWEQGKNLVNATLAQYRKKHGKLPRKVSYTFWAGEFIQSEGATLAQCFYMLGVEPVRDNKGRVTDLRLIPSEELGRPRINIVVQVSGQLRDLAASRLILLNKAVQMAAASNDKAHKNLVQEDAVQSEKMLVEQGMAPGDARRLATMRVFGGLNGRYGTGIKEMVEQGDAWDSRADIAKEYMRNMGAIYGTDEDWGAYKENLLAIALSNTDVVMQPRQNNTWGALTLDHMYEFMGGMNVSVKNVTGKDPETYLSDYRNRNRVRMQELNEAIGVESRTTILNPTYIKAKMEGGATSANTFSKILLNSFGWEAMKPDAIADNYWDEVYRIYVQDSCELHIADYFDRKNPAAYQEMTSIMLETARKGMWKASDEQVKKLAQLSAELTRKYGADASDFFASNTQLQAFVQQKLPAAEQSDFRQAVQQLKDETTSGKSIVMKKDSPANPAEDNPNGLRKMLFWGAILLLLGGALWLILHRRKHSD